MAEAAQQSKLPVSSSPQAWSHLMDGSGCGRAAASFAPSAELFNRLFPMHLVLDQECRLVQVRGGWVWVRGGRVQVRGERVQIPCQLHICDGLAFPRLKPVKTSLVHAWAGRVAGLGAPPNNGHGKPRQLIPGG